jgi:hypothetical protein
MSDKVPVYVFVADVPIQVGTLDLNEDGTFSGSIRESMYKTLTASKRRWFFAIHPEK